MGKNISTQLEKIINDRKSFIVENNSEKCIPIVDGVNIGCTGQVIYPILCEGDIIGSVIIMPKTEEQDVSDTEQKLASVAALFLGKQMEA